MKRMKKSKSKETDVKDAFSKGNIPALLRKLAIPGVISQVLLLLYNMVDRIYLGHLNDGGTALLAVGLCLPITNIFNAVAFLFGQGGAARAMIKLGSGRRDEAETIMGNSVISIILSASVGGSGRTLRDDSISDRKPAVHTDSALQPPETDSHPGPHGGKGRAEAVDRSAKHGGDLMRLARGNVLCRPKEAASLAKRNRLEKRGESGS